MSRNQPKENIMKKTHKILFIIAAILALASWVISISYWGSLPKVIPVHFGLSGQADSWANKSIFYVYFIPLIQTVFLAAMGFLYRKPQYSDIPTTMWLMTIDKKHRDHAFGLIRTMLVGTSVWLGMLFTYLTYGINASALNEDQRLSVVVMVLLIMLMIAWLIYWAIKVYRATKEAVADTKK